MVRDYHLSQLRDSSIRSILASTLVLALSLAVVACQGPAGRQGPPGAAAEPNGVDESRISSRIEKMLEDSQAGQVSAPPAG